MVERFAFAVRWIPGVDVDRARWRNTLTYRFAPTLTAGLEYNPLADDLGVVANWLALPETESAPALIFGTSSDRIGTTHGRAVYGTFSKDIEAWTGLPIAPYVGVSYGGFDDEFQEIGGLMVRWSEDWSSTHLWDGENLHHILETVLAERYTVGLVVVDVDGEYDVGVTLGFGFAAPWED